MEADLMLNISRPSTSSAPSTNQNMLRRKEKYSITARKNRSNNKFKSVDTSQL